MQISPNFSLQSNEELKHLLQTALQDKEKYKMRTKQLIEKLDEERNQSISEISRIGESAQSIQSRLEKTEQELSLARLELATARKLKPLSQQEFPDTTLKQLNDQLVQTINSLLTIINYQLQDCKQPPDFLQKIYNTLCVKSFDAEVIPVFIGKNATSLELQVSTNSVSPKSQARLQSLSEQMQQHSCQEPKLGINQHGYKLDINGIHCKSQELSDLDHQNFVPLKAFKLAKMFQNKFEIPNAHLNSFLIALGTIYKEYFQEQLFESTNQVIKKQKKKIEELQRKLQSTMSYQEVQSQQTIQRLRQDLLKYTTLYQQAINQKPTRQHVNVRIGDFQPFKPQQSQIDAQIQKILKVVEEKHQESGKSFAEGGIAVSKALMQLIEESLARIYKNGNAEEELQNLQMQCRMALVEVLGSEGQ